MLKLIRQCDHDNRYASAVQAWVILL